MMFIAPFGGVLLLAMDAPTSALAAWVALCSWIGWTAGRSAHVDGSVCRALKAHEWNADLRCVRCNKHIKHAKELDG